MLCIVNDILDVSLPCLTRVCRGSLAPYNVLTSLLNVLQLVSTVFTIAAVGGAIFLFVKARGSKPEASSDVADDSIDPVASARRIMDKYK